MDALAKKVAARFLARFRLGFDGNLADERKPDEASKPALAPLEAEDHDEGKTGVPRG
jgi:hypothetical protein